MNPFFLFQGCQKMPIRVPISLADIEIQFLNWCQMIGKLSANNAMVSESLGELVYLTAYCKFTCVWSNRDSDMSMPYCSTPIRPLRTWLSECSKGAFWGLKVSNSAWLHFTRPLAQPPFSLLTLLVMLSLADIVTVEIWYNDYHRTRGK